MDPQPSLILLKVLISHHKNKCDNTMHNNILFSQIANGATLEPSLGKGSRTNEQWKWVMLH